LRVPNQFGVGCRFMATRRRKAKPEEVRALAHPLRLRIIRLLYDGPRSNKELATHLGEDPATVLYHVRTLLRAGFVAAAGTRPGARGSVEKLYRTTNRSWKLDVDAGLPAQKMSVARAGLEAFLAEVQDVDMETARLALVLSRERKGELTRRIGEVLDEFALRDDPGGEPWAVFFALHRRV
jgi:DNA-binding transcriptional ArsR family regulator